MLHITLDADDIVLHTTGRGHHTFDSRTPAGYVTAHTFLSMCKENYNILYGEILV